MGVLFGLLHLCRKDNAPTISSSGSLGVATVTAGGTDYETAPSVSLTGGGGSGATAFATVSEGVVTGVTITNKGRGCTSALTIDFTGGAGSDATATVVLIAGHDFQPTVDRHRRGTERGKEEALAPTDELWCELVMNGIGGRTIAEAQQNMTYPEFMVWMKFRAKRGSLHQGMRD